MRVMTIIGTRPEIIKLSCVIEELDKYTEQIIVHTGQNYDYELNQIFFEDMGIRKPDIFLDAAGNTPAETIANVITKSDEIIKREKPDAILVYGDTNSCLSVISAKRNKVPIFHMEAGNRCFDQRVPEELNRKIIDHISDINMTLTEHAREYLLSEGINPETVIKVGSSMKEVLDKQKEKVVKSPILKDLGLNKNDYFIVSLHREENLDYEENFSRIVETLNKLAQNYKKRIIVSTHPRTRKLLEKTDYKFEKLLEFMKPMGFSDYINLQKNAFCVISDSGTITEESSIIGFPAITIRQAHERPEGMDEATLIMSALDYGTLDCAIKMVTSQGNMHIVKDYDVDNVSKKVVRIILSYTSYINRTVWHKEN